MILDLFAGPGGWDEGLLMLGITDVLGVELDSAACQTRAAAGHVTHRGDVAALDPRTVAPTITGLIASPPCQLYSLAGKGHGRDAVPILTEAMRQLIDGQDVRATIRAEIADTLEPLLQVPEPSQGTLDLIGIPSLARAEAERLAYQAALVLEPARWTEQLRPRWIALEQVPSVLPLWEALGHALQTLGYTASTGILNAADYGVPQTRRRAILVAHTDRAANLPTPTHAKGGANGLHPWVSMAEALGWGLTARPAPTMVAASPIGGRRPLDGGSGARDMIRREQADGRWRLGFPRRDDRGDSEDGYRDRDWRNDDEPAFALTQKARSWRLEERQPHGASRDMDEPAMTITGSADNGNFRFVLNTGRYWKPGGSRDDCQRIDDDEPAPTLTAKSGEQWWLERPATTLSCDPRVFPPGGHYANDGRDNSRMVGRSETNIHLTVPQALTLQTFRPDYPVQGSKSKQFEQVGNAVPPRLAAHIVAELTGHHLQAAA